MSTWLTALIFLLPVFLFFLFFVSSEAGVGLVGSGAIIIIVIVVGTVASFGANLLFDTAFPTKEQKKEKERRREIDDKRFAEMKKIEETAISNGGEIIYTRYRKFIFDFTQNELTVYNRDTLAKCKLKLDRLVQAFVFVDGKIENKFIYINKRWELPNDIKTGFVLFFSLENGKRLVCPCENTEIDKMYKVIEILSNESIYNIQLQ